VIIPVGGYDFSELHLLYNFGPQRPVSANVAFEYGQFYHGTRTGISTSRGRLQINPQVTLEPGLTLNIVNMPEATSPRHWSPRGRLHDDAAHERQRADPVQLHGLGRQQ
jgi:hypothetical protein